VKSLVFVYYFCDKKKHVQGDDYNEEKDMEALADPKGGQGMPWHTLSQPSFTLMTSLT